MPGLIDEMAPRTLALLQRFRQVLELSPLTHDVDTDPLEAAEALPARRTPAAKTRTSKRTG